VYLYQGNLSEAISVLKYGKDLSLIRPLQDALVMGACFLDLPLVEAVVPVPISRSVLFGRGFNCAELLAKPLAAHLDVPVIKGAIAKKGKVPQVRLGRSGRINNAAISFSPGRGLKRISGRKVLLVDDVYTTGATAKACTRILRSAGAEVSVLTLARAGKRTVIGVR
jgi:ComF family protein